MAMKRHSLLQEQLNSIWRKSFPSTLGTNKRNTPPPFFLPLNNHWRIFHLPLMEPRGYPAAHCSSRSGRTSPRENSMPSHVLFPSRIIPIFLIHRPENNIPYATVEEELIGEFVKYSIRDGKEINFLRRESEAGQKCCTFQHWVYQKTSGCLLVTDMQGEQSSLAGVQGCSGSGMLPGVEGKEEGAISWAGTVSIFASRERH